MNQPHSKSCWSGLWFPWENMCPIQNSTKLPWMPTKVSSTSARAKLGWDQPSGAGLGRWENRNWVTRIKCSGGAQRQHKWEPQTGQLPAALPMLLPRQWAPKTPEKHPLSYTAWFYLQIRGGRARTKNRKLQNESSRLRDTVRHREARKSTDISR